MSNSRQIAFPARELQIKPPSHKIRLSERISRSLHKIRKPATAMEITELLNGDLDPGELPFEVSEVSRWLSNADEYVVTLYWLKTRPRK